MFRQQIGIEILWDKFTWLLVAWLLVAWLLVAWVLGASPASGWQDTILTKPEIVDQEESVNNEIIVNRNGQLQTFRIRRSHSVNGEWVEKLVNRVTVQSGNGSQRKIQIRSHQSSGTARSRTIARDLKLDNLAMLTTGVPGQSGGRQIIVEMKKVTDQEKELSIGEIAPSSWIQSNNGIVHLFTDSLDSRSTEAAHYWIGVQCQEALDQDQQRKRLVVQDVVRDSAAEKAGIRKADWIVDWNQTPLSTVDVLVKTIQKNESNPAKVGILRNGSRMELDIVPRNRNEFGNIRTIIAPATSVHLARQRIDELQKLVSVTADGQNQEVRLLLVGPGVNFGKADIELQISQDVQRAKSHLTKLLDRVADKQFGLIFEDDSVTLKKAPNASGQLGMLNFEPHEIWETMEIGVKGHSIPMAQLVPRVVLGKPSRLELSPELENNDHAVRKSVHQLKTGQIVFPNRLIHFDLEVQTELKTLRGENHKIRMENQVLKDQINKLKAQLKQQN